MADIDMDDSEVCFHDFLPIMAQKMNEKEFVEELCNGFRMVADPSSATITFASLKKNARWLGLEGMSDADLHEMILEGDVDQDGALSEREFIVFMIRSNPALLSIAQEWVNDALNEELAEFLDDEDDGDDNY